MKVENLSVKFDKEVLSDVSFQTEKTGVYCIVAPSGAGKTTLFNAIANEVKFSGKISGQGKVAYLFQEDTLLPWLTLKENVYLPLDENQKPLADYYLKAFGLFSEQEKRPAELSGGQKRRGAIARTLAFGGDTFLLDEPFKGLDEENVQIICAELKKLAKKALVLIITHEKSDVEKLDARFLDVAF